MEGGKGCHRVRGHRPHQFSFKKQGGTKNATQTEGIETRTEIIADHHHHRRRPGRGLNHEPPDQPSKPKKPTQGPPRTDRGMELTVQGESCTEKTRQSATTIAGLNY